MKPETKYSLLILGLSVIWKTGLLLSGQADGLLGKYPLLPVLGFMLIGMYRGVEERRKLSHPNGMGFLDAFKPAISIALLASLIYTLFLYVYLNYLDVDFKARFVANSIEDLKTNGSNPADIEAWIQSTQTFPFTTAWILFTFIGLALIGFVYAVVIGRLMLKKYPISRRKV